MTVMLQARISDKIHFLGFNDRRTHLFENLWPIPRGVSYNSYLITDEKIAVVDTVDKQFTDEFLDQLEILTGNRPVDYLIINHMEPDHSGALQALVARYPSIILVGNKKTFGLVESFSRKPVRIFEVGDNDRLDLGFHTLLFRTIPMVHWPETMVTFEPNLGLLFSGDAFGSFGTLDGAVFDDELDPGFLEPEMMRYFTNIVGKYSAHTRRAIAKLGDWEIKTIAPVHGPVWRSDPGWVIGRYDRWSSHDPEKGVVIVYGTMYGHTQQMAELLARRLVERGIREIRVYDASKTHLSYLINDVFRFRGFIAGSCAYNNELFPPVQALIQALGHMGLKNHLLGIFGNFLWSGGGVKNLLPFADNPGWELVHEPVEEKGALRAETAGALQRLADAMAERLG